MHAVVGSAGRVGPAAVPTDRWRFDSPPKEEEYARDALLTGGPMGFGGVAAALQGGLSLTNMSPLSAAADTKAVLARGRARVIGKMSNRAGCFVIVLLC